MAKKAIAEEAIKKVEDQLECAICLQAYTDPKLLPCFHVYCQKCLERLVVQGQQGWTVTCPKCRRESPVPQNSIAALQSAFHIAHLFDIRDTLEKLEKTQCEKCRKKATATGYCRDCGKFVCDKCIDIHQDWEEFTEHKIVSLSEVQKEASSLVTPKKKVLYCSKHQENTLKIYCETCKELICTDCTIRLHHGHQYDLVTDTFPKHRDEIRAHLQPVRQQLDAVNTALRTFDTQAKRIRDQRAAIEGDIHKQIEELHQALDQRRGQLVGELDALIQKKLKSLAAQRDGVEMVQAQLSSCLEYIEGSLTTSTPAEILALKDPAIKQIQGMTANFNPDSLAPKKRANLKLEVGNLKHHCLQYGAIAEIKLDPDKCQVTGVGSEMATVDEQATLSLETKDEDGKETSVPPSAISAELVHCTDHTVIQCEVKRKGESTYTLSYSPTTRGRHQLHIKIDQSSIGCSPLPVVVRLPPQRLRDPLRTIGNLTKPLGVAVNSKGEILVSETTLNIYTPEGQKVKTCDNVQQPWGISFDSVHNILVASSDSNQVHKFSPNGELVQSVGTRGRGSLQFKSPRGIAYSKRNGKIYVSDNENHRVQVLNEDLTFSTTFGAYGSGKGQLYYPWGLTVDSGGNVYIADAANGRIQVFTAEGRFLRSIGTKGSGPGQLDWPSDVHVDVTGTVYIPEKNNLRISIFTADGQFLKSFGQGQLCNPCSITMDANGFLVVGDLGHNCLNLY